MTSRDGPVIARIARAEERPLCLRIRLAVFVDEQGVPPDREIDGLDDAATHFIALRGAAPVATARVLITGGMAKIQRFAVCKADRGQGVGSLLLRTIEDTPALHHGGFMLEAQTHAVAFYHRLGYRAQGPEFIDAGIPHRLMTKPR